MDIFIDYSAWLLPLVAVFLEGICNQFIMLVMVQFDLSSEQYFEETWAGQERIGFDNMFLEISI